MSDEPEMLDDGDLLVSEEMTEIEALDDSDLLQDAPPPTRHGEEIPAYELSPEDQEFIQRVFTQVKDVDFHAPPPPPQKGLSGLDKKLQFLREKVRELERDLARVGHVWRHKQAQVDHVDVIVKSKEAERAAAVERYGRLKQQATVSIQAAKQEAARVTQERDDIAQKLAHSEAEVARLTTDVTRLEAEGRALREDAAGKLNTAKQAFDDLREQSSNRIDGLQSELAERTTQLSEEKTLLQQSLEATQAELVQTQEQLADTARQRDEAVTSADQERSRFEQERTQIDASQSELKERLGEKDASLSSLVTEMGQTRTELQGKVDAAVAERDAAIAERDALKQELLRAQVPAEDTSAPTA